MRKSILVAVTLATVALFAMIAVAYSQSPMGMGMGRMHGMMFEKLKLTDDQLSQLQNLRIQHQKDMISKQAELKLAKLNLKEIMMKPKVDESAALKQSDKISSIKADIAKLKLQFMLDARKVLTPDQVKEFMQMHQEMGFGRGDRDGCPMGQMGCSMTGCGMGSGMHPGMGRGMGKGMGQGMGSQSQPEESK